MLALKKVAITGSPASGKSTVCSYLRERGAYVVSCDHILHTAFDHSEPLKHALTQILGNEILDKGSVSRKRVADTIFSNRELLHAVETVCHEFVFQALQNEFEKALSSNFTSVFVAEVPLLYESSHPVLLKWFDTVIFVHAPTHICCTRYQARGNTEEDFKRRMERFLPNEEKYRLAHFSIENSGTLDDLKRSVDRLIPEIWV